MNEALLLNNPEILDRPGFVTFYGLWSDFYKDEFAGFNGKPVLDVLKDIERTQLELAGTFYGGIKEEVVETSNLALRAVQQIRREASQITPEDFSV